VYTALPDMRIPYDNDGTAVAFWGNSTGVYRWLTGAELLETQDNDYVLVASGAGQGGMGGTAGLIMFFPEQREVTAVYAFFDSGNADITNPVQQMDGVAGSNDSGNSLDGTWETASMGGGMPVWANAFGWRADIKPVSFTGPKRTIRVFQTDPYERGGCYICHVYGEKAAGQTPNDIIYINHDDTPGVEYAAAEDFGDRPLGTTSVRQFRIKNTSSSLTANTINIQCNDTDFAISTDNSTYVVTINIGSLAPGAESGTMYIRNTTPAPGNPLGPRFARIVTIVGSWT